MKAVFTRKTGRGGILLAGCIALFISTGVAAPPQTIPGTYATVVIGDIPGMIDRVADFGQKVNPDVTGDSLRGYLGMMLGDAGLKSIPPGSGLVLTVPETGKPFVLLQTAEGKAEAIGTTLKQRTGAMTHAITPGLLAVSPDQTGIDNANAEMGKAVAALLDGEAEKALLVTVDADKLIKDKGAKLQAALKSLPEKAAASGVPQSSATATRLVFLGNVISAAAKRTDVVTIKMTVSGDGIQFEKELFPVGGLNLGTPEGPTGQDVRKSLPAEQDAAFSFEYYIDTQSALKAVQPMIMEVITASGVSAADKAEIDRLLNVAGEAYGDGFGGWAAPGTEGTQGAYMFSVADQAKAMDALRLELESMTTGSLANFYSGLGLETSATLIPNALTVDGQPVHKLSVSLESTGDDSKSEFLHLYDVRKSFLTFVDGKLLMTLGDVPLESALAKVKAGTDVGGSELKSRTELPPGAFFYADYHPAEMMPEGSDSGASKFLEALKGSTVYEAAYATDESIKLMLVIPSDMVAKAATLFKQAAQKRAALQDDSPMSTSTLDDDGGSTSVLDGSME